MIKHASLFLAAAVSCGAAAAADAPRLALWITDPIEATNATQCRAPTTAVPYRLPKQAPTLTELDVVAWNAAEGRWTLDPARFPAAAAFDLHDHCFVLAIDGRLAANGVVLSSHSARLIDFPTISVIHQKGRLDLQLTSTFHGSYMHPLHTEALNAVLGQPANLQVQLQHAAAQRSPPPGSALASNARDSGQPWSAAVQKLIERGEIRQGMPIADAIKYLGPASSVNQTENNKGVARYSWYFNTPRHVNPLFEIWTEDGIVRRFNVSRGDSNDN